jgi:sugar phosphate isomerase/epimerase
VRNPLSTDIEGTIQAIADIGYNSLELFGYGNDQYFGMPASDFYNLVKGKGLKIRSSHHGTGRMNPEARGTLVNGWEKAVEDAVSAGQEYMVCPWISPEERKSMDSYKELCDLLNNAGDICKKSGLQLCYHNHDFEFVELEGELPMYYLLDNTDAELVKMELDLYWITKAGFDPIEFFEKYPGRTPLWHVKDMDKTPERGFAEVGEGIMDWNKIFAASEKSGLDYFFVEQDVSENPIESITTSFKNLNESILKS